MKTLLPSVILLLLQSGVLLSKLTPSIFSGSILQTKANGKAKTIMQLRGGSIVANTDEVDEMSVKNLVGSSTVIVSTSIGSTFLDKKKKIVLDANSTVSDLKLLIFKKFPGCPPVAVQRLIFGLREIANDEIIGNLTTATPIPLMLDIISGTSAYNKTITVSQALEAYSSLAVHQAYLGDQLKQFFSNRYTSIVTQSQNNQTSGDNDAPFVMETATYREMLEAINSTLYSTYCEDILEALEDEREPEMFTADTAAWRSVGSKAATKPLAAALAKEFDLNLKSIKGFVYYSFLLGIFAWFGTTTELSSQFLVFMVPMLWISKLRQLRLLFKLLLYMVLPIIPRLSFLMPLLPAPYQVIALQSLTRIEEDDSESMEASQDKHTAVDFDALQRQIEEDEAESDAKEAEVDAGEDELDVEGDDADYSDEPGDFDGDIADEYSEGLCEEIEDEEQDF